MRITLLVIASASLTGAEQAAVSSIPLPYAATLNFTVNLHNSQEARATNSNTLSNPIGNSPGSLSPLLDKIAHVWINPETNQTLVKRLGNNTGSFLNDYKWPLALGTLITGYGYLCYIIALGNSYFAQKDLWANWRQDLTLEQLLAIPQPQFAKELLQEIQRRYTDPAAVTDIVRPLGTFMKVIEQEEQQLLWYQNAFSWLQYIKATPIIPLSVIQFTKIGEKIQRLIYFKNAFQSWAAQYQLDRVSRALSFNNETDIPDVRPMAVLMAYHYKISLLGYLAKKQSKLIPQS